MNIYLLLISKKPNMYHWPKSYVYRINNALYSQIEAGFYPYKQKPNDILMPIAMPN